MSGRSKIALRLGRNWQHRLSTGLLLLAFSAFFLQPVAHASPSGHSAHAGAAAGAMAQPCAQSHASGDIGEISVEKCDSDDAELTQVDCCQACLVAAIPPEMPLLLPSVSGDHLSRIKLDRFGCAPTGILRPPRLITAA